MDLSLAGKVALVTGGSRDIGRATALTLAQEGCRLAICARGEDTLEAALDELRAITPEVWGKTTDVTDADEVREFVSGAAAALGGVDALVCNVGGTVGGATSEASDEEWMATLDLNLLHAVRTIRAALPYLREREQSSVVIVSSVSGWKPGPKAQYSAAKAAEIFLASSLAWELAEYRIRVNTVSPTRYSFREEAGPATSKTAPRASPGSWNGTCRRVGWGQTRRSRT